MAKKPENLIKEIKMELADKGYVKDIPLDVWYAAFMIKTGYGKNKMHEWTENFELVKLIEVKDHKLNFL